MTRVVVIAPDSRCNYEFEMEDGTYGGKGFSITVEGKDVRLNEDGASATITLPQASNGDGVRLVLPDIPTPVNNLPR